MVEWIKNWDEVKAKPPTGTNNDVIGRCPKCGLELNRIMHYVCIQGNCPTGLGGTMSTW